MLIENKVGAGFQQRQAMRYRERASAYRDRGEVASVVLVLVAPARYLGAGVKDHGFDSFVSYEAIRDWFIGREALGARRLYKAELLESAIEKAVLGYTPVADEPVSEFWSKYT